MSSKMKFNLFNSLSVFLLWGCSGGSLKVGESLPAPKNYSPSSSEQLTLTGENYGAHFSSDGKRILFISRNRAKHKQPQVYEYDLNSRKERRITFQDGEIFDVTYGKKTNDIFYSSTTDEIKENPRFIRDALRKMRATDPSDTEAKNFYDEILPATEVYTSSPDGRNIRRLTNADGFDGMISSRGSNAELAIVTVRDGKKRLSKLHVLNRTTSPLTATAIDDEFPAFSPDGKHLLWSRSTALPNTSEIWSGDSSAKNAKALIAGNGHHVEPSWHPQGDEILFVSNRDESANFEIYAAKKDGSCIRRLTYHSSLDRSPELSPDGKKLLFSSNRSGVFQLYLATYNPPPCPP